MDTVFLLLNSMYYKIKKEVRRWDVVAIDAEIAVEITAGIIALTTAETAVLTTGETDAETTGETTGTAAEAAEIIAETTTGIDLAICIS